MTLPSEDVVLSLTVVSARCTVCTEGFVACQADFIERFLPSHVEHLGKVEFTMRDPDDNLFTVRLLP